MRKQAGQALIEFALILPLMVLLIINVVNFGAFFYAAICVANGARAGADAFQMGSISAVSLNGNLPTFTTIQNAVNTDLQQLNMANVTITYCTNAGGHILSPGTCLAKQSDATGIVGEVNVTYLFTPVISVWDFGKLGVHLTLPRTSIHRAATVKMML